MSGSLKRALAVVTVAALAASLWIAGPVSASGSTHTYLILYSKSAVPSDAAGMIAASGGTLIAKYSAIGVVVARSDSSTFRSKVLKDSRVSGAAATGAYGVQLSDPAAADDGSADSSPSVPATDSDNLSGLQWDMIQIHTPEAHAISGGSSSVLVGDIDTGLDYTHPDLAANVDFANSASCVSGVPDTDPAAWKDDNGHGTHTAGTIAAAANGIGIVGVAPNVRIAAIKAGDAAGFFFPESVVCAFMWAAARHMDVTNNSYFADPWLFNCRNDPVQRAIWNAERRAIRWAESHGVVVVAAAGNQADDLAHPTQDATSPDDTSPVLRQISNDCAVVPVEVPGVVGVSADGNLAMKSFYSSYGVGSVEVTAPGGDSILQRTAAAPNGRVLSTWPSYIGCTRLVVDVDGSHYCYLQGTSMASPHVAGIAALLRSQHPRWSAGAVAAAIGSTADPMACPSDVSAYAFFPAVDNGAPQTCQGGAGSNSWFGHGQVNALSAVNK